MFEREVERGAKLLDEVAPGWENKINIPNLEMDRCGKCIVGQLLWASIITDKYDYSEQYGFDIAEIHFTGDYNARNLYDNLFATWVDAINERKARNSEPIVEEKELVVA